MDNAQKHNNCIKISLSQTFISYLHNQYGLGTHPKLSILGPEMGTGSVSCAQLSRFHLKTE
jgi:hypothetical protein